MTDLKELFEESVREAEESIQRTRRNTRPAPSLPEGYREEDKQLISPEGHRIAWTDESAELRVNHAVSARHFQALAIWLQKRTNNTTGEKQ